jgi:inhibitor of KinA
MTRAADAIADYRIVAAGDAALTIELEERIDPAVNSRAIAMADAVRRLAADGVRDVVAAYRSVTVYFDPLRTDYAALEASLGRVGREACGATAAGRAPIRVPVCYGGDFGPDLADVARLSGMTETEVTALHSAPEYRVYMLGFVPGFAYMGSVDPRIAAPRRRSPRLRVPAGSVAIAEGQTGIYPAETPGGWQLIGRTAMRAFDIERTPAFLLNPGDTVQFYPIERRELDRVSEGLH